MTHDVGALADFPSGTATRVRVDGVDIAVVNTNEGLFAIEDRCSHADVALSEGEIVGCTIECWLHGSAFDLRTGEPLSLPANLPVRVFPIALEIVDGIEHVMITVSTTTPVKENT